MNKIFPQYITDENIIRKNPKLIDWDKVSASGNLFSEQFIDEFKNYFNWNILMQYNHFSEQFIEKYTDKYSLVTWKHISNHQKLSEQFIRKHMDKLCIPTVVKIQDVSKELEKELWDYYERKRHTN